MSISLTALLLIGLTLALWIYTLIFLHSVMMERNLLRKLAYQDPVTGLFNRNALELFWKRSNGKEAFAIMYLDLDGFKAI
ncbi:GGDEF domain-containing protein [Paenibacillus polymyxa]|nr:GGDEF domain-containing protein [Paenibacillus polymyxa]